MSSISGISGSAVSSGDSGGGSIASQIAALNKQIQNVSTQIKELADNKELTDEQKAEMEQMYQSQITMIQAQIAQLEQSQAEKDQPKDDSTPFSAVKADGINRPTATNTLNVYI